LKHLLRFVAALGILAVPAAAHAQVTGGVRAGVNFANLAFDPKPPVDPKTLTGLVVGGFATIPITAGLGFQPEALFSMQGNRFSEQGQTIKTKIDYLQVPLLLRVRTGARSPVSILAGPSLGFRTRGRVEGSDGTSNFNDDITDDVKAFDGGLVAGVDVAAGPHLVFDARYTWGLTNIAKDSTDEFGNTASAKNRVFSLSAGVRF
jgi:hypothetical protein